MPSQPAEQPVHLLRQCASGEQDVLVAFLLGPALELQELELQAEEVVLPIQHLPALQVLLPIHPVTVKIVSTTVELLIGYIHRNTTMCPKKA